LRNLVDKGGVHSHAYTNPIAFQDRSQGLEILNNFRPGEYNTILVLMGLRWFQALSKLDEKVRNAIIRPKFKEKYF
jgi:hypothetical protein